MTQRPADPGAALRELPAVDRLARAIAEAGPATEREATAAARAVLDERRAELLAGGDGARDLVADGHAWLARRTRRVLNATGVVIHTNLGRAPLAPAAVDAVADAAAGYLDLELDLKTGRRAARGARVTELLRELTGAEDALAVNNGAGAVLLAAAALAGNGGSIVVSRGQLVEIGGGFRIPDVVAQAGARLVEVGTTNRTRVADYERAIADAAAPLVVLRVHQSNFRTVGFVEEPSIEELCGLGVPVIDDVGSGALAELEAFADEPPVQRSIAAGAAVVCFSGDKLLGGPQAGILVGASDPIAACRRHPLARALRAGRLPLAALEATLGLYRDPERALREIPVLRMLAAEPGELEAKAERLAAATGGRVVRVTGRVGGGALPLLDLRGPAVALAGGRGGPEALARALREGEPPVLPRIAGDRVLLDPRTLLDDELDAAAAAARAALGAVGGER